MPQPWSPATKRLVVVALVLVGLWVAYLARGLLTPLVLGLLLALVLNPVIGFLQRRLHFRHGLAVAASYLLFLAAVVVIPLLFIPALVRSAAALDIMAIVTRLTEWAIDVLRSFRVVEVLGSRIDLRSSIDPLIESLRQEGEGLDFDIAAVLGGAWDVTSAVFTGVVGVLTTLLLALVISIYLAGSFDRRARAWMYSLAPVGHGDEMRILGARIARVWTGYLSGQLTVALVVGTVTALIMFALGLPGALVIGVIGGFFNIIPTFGPIFAAGVAAVVALIQGSYRLDVSNVIFALIVVGAYAVIQQLESNVLTPRILGGAVDVSPLAILLGILVGFSTAGVLGAIVAVPVVATGREVLRYVQAKLVDLDPFPEGPPPPRPTLISRLERLRQRASGEESREQVDGREALQPETGPAGDR